MRPATGIEFNCSLVGKRPVPAVVTELTTLRAARKGIKGDGRGIVGIMARDRPCHAERKDEAVDWVEGAGSAAAAAMVTGVGVEGAGGVAIESGDGVGAAEGGDEVAVVVVVVVVVVFEVVVVDEVVGET